MTGSDKPSGQVFFEFTQLGGQMRIAALDEATGIEVVVIAPLTATRLQMQSLGLAKLRRRLAELPTSEPTRRLF